MVFLGELKQIEKYSKKKHQILEICTKFLEVTSKNASAECLGCFVTAIHSGSLCITYVVTCLYHMFAYT